MMTSENTSHRRPRPFQFGIGAILILTTLGAVVIGIGRAIEAPVVWQIGIAGYVFFLLAYAFFRIPYLLRVAFGQDSDWQRVREKRKGLEQESSPSEEEQP